MTLATPNKMVTVMGQRSGKREPIVDSKTGVLIDDGANNPITLCSNFPEDQAKSFMANLKGYNDKKVWKFWIV